MVNMFQKLPPFSARRLEMPVVKASMPPARDTAMIMAIMTPTYMTMRCMTLVLATAFMPPARVYTMKMMAKAMAEIQKGMPRRLSPSLPAAIIWLRPTASMTMVRMMQLTVRAWRPKNFSMMPGTVPVSRERKSLAKRSPRNRTPMPFAMVYHQPERP